MSSLVHFADGGPPLYCGLFFSTQDLQILLLKNWKLVQIQIITKASNELYLQNQMHGPSIPMKW